MMSPTLGRWLQEDPIGFEAGDVNLYRYVGNHPTSALDPSGLGELDIEVVVEPNCPEDGWGKFETKTRWKIKGEASKQQCLIIQHVDYKWIVQTPDGKEVNVNIYWAANLLSKNFSTAFYPYKEAWVVEPGKLETTIAAKEREAGKTPVWDDSLFSPGFDPKRPTIGQLIITVEAKMYENAAIPPGWKVFNTPPTGVLPAIRGLKEKDPWFRWPDEMKVKLCGTVKRKFTITWNDKGKTNLQINKVDK